MRVFVAGATGILGRHAIPHLLALGHEVVGLARTDERADVVRGLGATPAVASVFDPDALARAAAGCTAALHLATRIPRALRTTAADWAENDRIRTEGTRCLLAAAEAIGARHYLQQSVTFLYGDHGDEWIDEHSPVPVRQPAVLRSALEMERLVGASPLPHAVLRGGSFYGPGTGTTETMLEMASRRRLPIVGTGQAFASLIHVEDMGRAVAAATDAELAGTFNVVDDEPVRQAHLLAEAARVAGASPPRRVPVWLARMVGGAAVVTVLRSQRVSNARLTAALDFALTYPTYREGLRNASEGRRSPGD